MAICKLKQETEDDKMFLNCSIDKYTSNKDHTHHNSVQEGGESGVEPGRYKTIDEELRP